VAAVAAVAAEGTSQLPEPNQQAYGDRGELWVAEQEKRSLVGAGRPDLAAKVVHKSLEDKGSAWDIESFAKEPPFEPIFIEVKSTPHPDDFKIHMSAEQIRKALSSSRPYFIYRVVEVNTDAPRAYKYHFRHIHERDLLRFSATNVEVTLPKPQSNA
jgi:hypothetical protein